MPASKLARDIMTRDVRTVSDQWSVEELSRFLATHSISGAPVTNVENKLVGVVSVTDISRAASELTTGRHSETTLYHHDYAIDAEDLDGMLVESHSQMSVAQIMTPMVFQVAADCPLEEIAETMVKGRIHRVFVLEQGKVAGVVSALDLLRFLTSDGSDS